MKMNDQLLDLGRIMKCFPKMEYLKVYSHDYARTDRIHTVSEPLDSKQMSPPTTHSMKEICLLNINDISIGSLEYIMYVFKDLKRLRVRSSILGSEVIDTKSSSSGSYGVNDMLDKFTSYCYNL
jgi:hypothetical protein